jgi:F-type H+-transporting ATPase subunit epsilon
VLADTAEQAEEIDVARAQEARARAERLLEQRPMDLIDRSAIEGALRRSRVRLKVARRRQRPSLSDISR